MIVVLVGSDVIGSDVIVVLVSYQLCKYFS